MLTSAPSSSNSQVAPGGIHNCLPSLREGLLKKG